jgi:hypothetical protein
MSPLEQRLMSMIHYHRVPIGRYKMDINSIIMKKTCLKHVYTIMKCKKKKYEVALERVGYNIKTRPHAISSYALTLSNNNLACNLKSQEPNLL